MDGQWMGEGSRDTYFSFSVEPGLYHLCSRRSELGFKQYSLHSLDAKAGETYYFFTRYIKEGYELELVDPDEGARLVAQFTFATSRQK